MSQVITPVDDGRRKPRVQTLNEEPSLTVQSEADQADIKKIIQRYERNGVLIKPSDVDMEFRDVAEFTDFADMMMQTKAAEQKFMALPSKVREVFNHSVYEWLDAAHDSDKLEALRPQLEKLGVLEPRAAPPAAPAANPASETLTASGEATSAPE